MLLKVISPERILFRGEVTKVSFPGTVGFFMVLKNHAPLVSTLVAGDIVFSWEEGEQYIPVKGGVVEVKDNIICVCLL